MDMWLRLPKSPNFFKFSSFMKLAYNVISKLHLISKMLKVFMTTTHSQQSNKLEHLWKILTEAKNRHFEVKKTFNCKMPPFIHTICMYRYNWWLTYMHLRCTTLFISYPQHSLTHSWNLNEHLYIHKVSQKWDILKYYQLNFLWIPHLPDVSPLQRKVGCFWLHSTSHHRILTSRLLQEHNFKSVTLNNQQLQST